MGLRSSEWNRRVVSTGGICCQAVHAVDRLEAIARNLRFLREPTYHLELNLSFPRAALLHPRSLRGGGRVHGAHGPVEKSADEPLSQFCDPGTVPAYRGM